MIELGRKVKNERGKEGIMTFIPRPELLYEIAVDKIIVPVGRTRQVFDQKKLRDLAESISNRKQDTPGICRHNKEGIPILVAGERRLRACELADVPFLYRLETSEDMLTILEIEVEENTQREDLTWQEEVDAVTRLQEVKQTIHGEPRIGAGGGWGITKTADFVGKAPSTISNYLEIQDFMHLEEVRNAPTITEARKVIKKFKETFERNIKFNEAKKLEGGESPIISPDMDEGEVTHVQEMYEIKQRMEHYSSRIHHGTMEEVLPTLGQKFELVIFDPPWGVDFTEVKKENPEQFTYEDSVEETQRKMGSWLSLLYEHMAENSHLYMFFGITNYDLVYNMLEKTGFQTNRIPLIWYKQGAGVTRNPDIWPGRCYEPIAFARKGSKIFIEKGAADVIPTKIPTPKMKKSHPSAKHPEVFYRILLRSAEPGDHILDPMCGSGMMGVAADFTEKYRKLDWAEIEKDKNFYHLAIENAIQGYQHIVYGEQQGEPERLDIFKSVKVGGEDWKRLWKEADSPLRERMMAWKEEQDDKR